MTPLITVLGASGFIGSSVVAALAGRGARVRPVGRREADLSVPGALAPVVTGSDVIVHLVAHTGGTGNWRDPDADPGARHLNEGLARELVDVVRAEARDRPPVVLFASTAHSADNAYGRQKVAAEDTLCAATEDGVLRAVPLRLTTVFGVGRDRGVVSTMIRRALAGEPLTMWHDGSVERDLLYVTDAAAAFTAALDHADVLAGRTWTVGSGTGVPLGDILRAVAERVSHHTGRPPVPVVRVDPPAYATAADFRHVRADAGPFRAHTGWHPATDLRTALDHTIEHLKNSQLKKTEKEPS
jgi:nucleoside-diphosphate-sugar epimerase